MTVACVGGIRISCARVHDRYRYWNNISAGTKVGFRNVEPYIHAYTLYTSYKRYICASPASACVAFTYVSVCVYMRIRVRMYVCVWWLREMSAGAKIDPYGPLLTWDLLWRSRSSLGFLFVGTVTARRRFRDVIVQLSASSMLAIMCYIILFLLPGTERKQ